MGNLPPEMQDVSQLDATDPYARARQTFPTLTDEQIERLKTFGEVEALEKGSVLFERGNRSVDFFVIIKGSIEIYDYHCNKTNIITTHRAHQFTGELDLFNDREILVGGRMGEDGQVLRIPRASFRRMLSTEPEIGEIITRAFILRRVGLISHEQGSVVLLCSPKSADTRRVERFLRRNGYPVKKLDDPANEQRQNMLEKFELSEDDLPAVYVHLNNEIIKNPSNFALAEALGLVENPKTDCVYDVAIVGAGPAGLSAATYAASEGLSTLLLEKEAPGGQASTSSKIENYLGFPTGISGQALAGRAQVQAQKFGATIALPRTVMELDCSKKPYCLTLCDGQKVCAHSIVIASGATYRRLPIEDNRKFDNAGVYYAATAMEGKLCEGEEVVVVGGGNSAGQAAVFLSGHAKHVHILIRRNDLGATMSDYLVERIASSPRITLHTQTEITALNGDRYLEEVTWKNNATGDITVNPIQHVFLMIGAQPNAEWAKDCVRTDEKGFIYTGLDVAESGAWEYHRAPMMLETSKPGVYAVGDVRAGSIKRVASGVGEGSMSISHVHQFLTEVR